jgi:hypothetical protein
MSRLKKLMSDFRKLKREVRLAKTSNQKNKLVASLMSIKGQHKEHNMMLIKKRKYSERWRNLNRSEVSRYNREYARIRRSKILNSE